MSRSLSLLLLVLMLQGCASSVVRNPVPEQELARASISGIPDARLSLAAVTVYSDATDLKKFRDMSEKLEEITGGAQLHPNFLAISGGGAEGAFTAGLLNGWTAAGDRPIFQIVALAAVAAAQSGIINVSAHVYFSLCCIAQVGSDRSDVLR